MISNDAAKILRADALYGRVSRRALIKRGVALRLSIPTIAGLMASYGSHATTAAQDNISLTFWTWFQGDNYETNLQHFIDTFREANPNVEIKYEELTWEEGSQKVTVQLAAGEPPDTMFAYFNPTWIDTGYMMPVDEYLTEEEKADFGDTLQYYTYDGKLMGFPIWKQMWNVSGNQELLEEAEIDWQAIQQNGWTFDEFAEVVQQLTKEEGRDGKQWGLIHSGTWANTGMPEMWQLWNANSGMPYAFDEQGTFLYNDPRALENLKRVLSYHTELAVSPPETPALQSDRRVEIWRAWQAVLIARSGPYTVPQETNRCAQIEAGEEEGACLTSILLPFPHLDGEKEGTSTSVPGHIAFKGDDDQGPAFYQAAVDFAKHMTSAEATCMWSADLYEVPARQSGIDFCQENGILDMADPNLVFFSEYFDRAGIAPRTLPAELNPKVTKAQQEGLFPSYEAMMLGAMSPEDAFERIVSDVERIMAEE
ncbi:MAG: ABC transporter substrate-binding protein [Thermomicrobiales bacterium]